MRKINYLDHPVFLYNNLCGYHPLAGIVLGFFPMFVKHLFSTLRNQEGQIKGFTLHVSATKIPLSLGITLLLHHKHKTKVAEVIFQVVAPKD